MGRLPRKNRKQIQKKRLIKIDIKTVSVGLTALRTHRKGPLIIIWPGPAVSGPGPALGAVRVNVPAAADRGLADCDASGAPDIMMTRSGCRAAARVCCRTTMAGRPGGPGPWRWCRRRRGRAGPTVTVTDAARASHGHGSLCRRVTPVVSFVFIESEASS